MAPRHRFLLIAVALSIAVHLAAALIVVYVPRVLPHAPRPQEQGTVELLMVERQGAAPSAAGPQQDGPPTPPQPQKPVEASKQAAPKPPAPKQAVPAPETPKPQTPAAASEPAPPPADKADATVPPATAASPTTETRAEVTPPKPPAPQAVKADQKPDAPQPAPPPVPPKAQEAPVFDLAGTESESNADVLGGHVVPASPDDRFRNRPPIYPHEAALHGEHGAVLLLIHVSEGGFATGVDVVESSGVASLDQAATDAVRKWHFRPALQEGRAVPFDMPFRFVFEAD